MMLSSELIFSQPSFSKALALCAQVSGLDHKEIYMSLGIDAGHWSRIMKGDAHFPVNKLNDLCDMCGNEVPLLWWAHSRGYGLVMLQSKAERIAIEERAKREEVERENRLLRELLQGKAA